MCNHTYFAKTFPREEFHCRGTTVVLYVARIISEHEHLMKAQLMKGMTKLFVYVTCICNLAVRRGFREVIQVQNVLCYQKG